MTNTVLSQIISIQTSCIVNMCDVRSVQWLAYQNDFFELVNYIEENPTRYFMFILSGEEPENVVD